MLLSGMQEFLMARLFCCSTVCEQVCLADTLRGIAIPPWSDGR